MTAPLLSAHIAEARNPIIRWEWVVDQWDQIREAIVEHLTLTLLAMTLGMAISAVLVAIALRYRWTMTPITATTSLIYPLPSVALFALLGLIERVPHRILEHIPQTATRNSQ